MSFLKAEWRKLVLANYAVEESALLPYLPPKTELDPWKGLHYVSLVGFMFKNVRVLGLKIPFHVNFEEVNLRFYVRYKSEQGEWRRGVVFIKEIVPRAAITFVANTIYKEHYHTTAMRHNWAATAKGQSVQYDWKTKDKWQSMVVEAAKESQAMPVGSEAEFITEHYWGFTKISAEKTFAYEVTHPRWQTYPVFSHKINLDFGVEYGERFAGLNHQEPLSVMLAEGSSITVEQKIRL